MMFFARRRLGAKVTALIRHSSLAARLSLEKFQFPAVPVFTFVALLSSADGQ
jgi:hypothetical protein